MKADKIPRPDSLHSKSTKGIVLQMVDGLIFTFQHSLNSASVQTQNQFVAAQW